MGRFPEWAERQKRKGTVIKSDGKGNYSLYRNSSKRVPGKKNPQPVQTYIGAITPQGVMERFTIDRKSSGIRIWEYGFSYALQSLTPPSFMKDLGSEERAITVLGCLIVSESDESYLYRSRDSWCEGFDGTCISAQRKKLERLMGFPFEHLAPLKRIRLVEIDGRLVMTEIGELQKQILEETGVELPWEVQ